MIKHLSNVFCPKAVRVEHSGKTLGIVSEHMSRNAVYVCDKLPQRAGFRAYIVGGAVRDALLVIPKDFDVATNATPRSPTNFAVRFHHRSPLRLVHVMFGDETIGFHLPQQSGWRGGIRRHGPHHVR